MEDLIRSQSTTGKEIQAIIANYKKDSQSRKTREYYVERLRRVEEAWATFDANDSAIRQFPEATAELEYFASGYYTGISKVVEQYKPYFRLKIEELSGIKEVGAIDRSCATTSNSGRMESSASEELVKLIRRQNRNFESIRRILNSINDEDHQPKQYHIIKLNSINQLWLDIQTIDRDIWGVSDNPVDHGYDTQIYEGIESEVQERLISLSTRIESLSTSQPTLDASAPIRSTANALLNLPKLTLPVFDGDYLLWPQFHDLFCQMVHNQAITSCQKMYYLKANLSGEAERLVRHFTIPEENYQDAWKTLIDRYNNKRLLVAALINKLLSQPSHAHDSATAPAIKSLHDTTQECLMGLQNLGISTESWDPLLLHLLTKNLDPTTHRLYEQSLAQPKQLQTLKDFMAFLEKRFESLEALGNKGKQERSSSRYTRPSMTAAATESKCVSCKGAHPLFSCKNFIRLLPSKRLETVKTHNLCFNCLRSGHAARNCTSRSCTKCGKQHNTLLHLDSASQNPDRSSNQMSKNVPSTINKVSTDQSITLAAQETSKRGYVLLGTAIVRLLGANGNYVDCRAMLDSGSQVNIITERVIKKLGVKFMEQDRIIQGIGTTAQQATRSTNIGLQSLHSPFTARLEALVLPKIIADQPAEFINIDNWPVPQDIALADPEFNAPRRIDLLLGAEFFHDLLLKGKIKLGESLPTLQNTVLGWVLSGKVGKHNMRQSVCTVATKGEDFDFEKFWKLEEVTEPQTVCSKEHDYCENHFHQTYQRDPAGAFVVRLPFNHNIDQLGESKEIAVRRFYALERRLAKQPDVKKQYNAFMDEYLRLGHMSELIDQSLRYPHYFMPHHVVLKPDSITTKLRVVFNASAKTSSNLSLNDTLRTGPTLHDGLFAILLRFRLPRFVFTADITKMYRMVKVHADDRRYQLIVWRPTPNVPLKVFQLNTVTYGTTAAPYLAVKCLRELGQLEGLKYPAAVEAINKAFYVDDVMTGADNLSAAREIQSQLTELLQKGGFHLHKWCANHPSLLANIPAANVAVQLDFSDQTEEHVNTLGLVWIPQTDVFNIKTSDKEISSVSKRNVSADISRLFDPLGIMGPVVVRAKIFLQQLWELNLDWDDALPASLDQQWKEFRTGLRSLSEIKLPRHVFGQEVPKSIQIHAFADASEKAYGGSIYIRSINNTGTVVVRLLCAKSKVAPVKKVTLPRLELCAAKLVADLTNRVKTDLGMKDAVTFFWTDSEIVLAWINSKSSSFQTFVANRIAAIQEVSIKQQWRHVKSRDNPADILSRGIAPERLGSHTMWFYGPTFLHGPETIWPPPYRYSEECELERKSSVLNTTVVVEDVHFLYRINHKNSFKKLQRITAYVVRFVANLRSRVSRRQDENLAPIELKKGLTVIIKLMQIQEFEDEIKQLQHHKELPRTSSLLGLSPFLDSDGIMRVGGRLENSSLSFDAKHPMLLPYSHPFTKLIVSDVHLGNCHVGPQALLAIVRQRFWPIKGKVIARSVVQGCVRCARAKPNLFNQIMGNLPAGRVEPARPFVNTGIDFCGPVWIHYQVRGKKPQKSYIAVFVCFATKATHLELVSNLTTEAFIAALKRFVGRRGNCKTIHCDNATNFVGTRNLLHELNESIYNNDARRSIQGECSQRGIDFHFIPPRAPHFGGLWEAAVKTAKNLLKKIVEPASLTHEQLETILIEIEAIMNSRPITPLSSNPNDLTALTPGHFLIGEPLTATIDPTTKARRVKLSDRWTQICRMKDEFWKRWTTEYLQQLQHKAQWKTECHNVKPGTMVMIKEDNMPPLKWSLGRVQKCHYGTDGRVRVVELRTASGNVTRAIHGLAPLPVEEESTNLVSSTTPEVTHANPETQPAIERRNDDDLSETPKKKLKMSMGSVVVSLLLACSILPTTNCSPLHVEQFANRPGIHFDNIGRMRLSSNEWKLIIYYDLQPYWDDFQLLAKGIQSMEHSCKNTTHNKSCETILSQIHQIASEISKDNDLLKPHRRKRGAFNIVGTIANSLFGILDEDYAAKISDTIHNVQQREDSLLALFKNQTSIIDATTNIIKRDQTAVKAKFDSLDVQLSRFRNSIVRQMEDTDEFELTTMEVMLMIAHIEQIQAILLEVLIDTHHQKLNPKLITPEQLKKELRIIKTHLPPNYQLPVECTDLSSMYKLMSIRAWTDKGYIIFDVRLPLVTLQPFEVFRLFPTTAFINESAIAIQISAPIIAISPHRDNYYLMTEQELRDCSGINQTEYLCEQLRPVYRKNFNDGICELHIFNQIPIKDECKVNFNESIQPWRILSSKNEWIFTLRDKTTLYAVCAGKPLQIEVSGSGILRVNPDCVIKQDTLTIYGHREVPTYDRISYSKIGINMTFESEHHTFTSADTLVTYQPDFENISQIKALLEVNKAFELPSVIDQPTVHHMSVSYAGLTIGLVCLVCIIWNRFRYRIPGRQLHNDTSEATQQADHPPSDRDFSINI